MAYVNEREEPHLLASVIIGHSSGLPAFDAAPIFVLLLSSLITAIAPQGQRQDAKMAEKFKLNVMRRVPPPKRRISRYPCRRYGRAPTGK